MNKQEIRFILNAHKEHFRVLPTLAMNEITGIIKTIDDDLAAEATEVVTTTEAKRDVGNRTRKGKKKSPRPRR